MNTVLALSDKSKQAIQDIELEKVLRVAESGIDEETRRFIEEVLKSVPSDPKPEVQIFTSHQGSEDAG